MGRMSARKVRDGTLAARRRMRRAVSGVASGLSKRQLIARLVLSVLFGTIILLGCGGGQQSMTTSPPPLTSPPTPTTLRVLYRVLYSGNDRMTNVDIGERSAYPFDGEIYYVPDQPGSGRTTLNRYFNAGVTDHADGTNSPRWLHS